MAILKQNPNEVVMTIEEREDLSEMYQCAMAMLREITSNKEIVVTIKIDDK